jgi:hypothetical protein
MRLHRALGKHLLDDLVLVAGAELVLELLLAGSVEDALLAVPVAILLVNILCTGNCPQKETSKLSWQVSGVGSDQHECW